MCELAVYSIVQCYHTSSQILLLCLIYIHYPTMHEYHILEYWHKYICQMFSSGVYTTDTLYRDLPMQIKRLVSYTCTQTYSALKQHVENSLAHMRDMIYDASCIGCPSSPSTLPTFTCALQNHTHV